MLDRDLLRHQPETVRAGLSRKGLDGPIEAFLSLDAKWRHLRTELEGMQARLNAASKSIGALMAQKKLDEANAAKAEAKALSDQLPNLEREARALEAELLELELAMPNLPHPSVPDGVDETQNVVVREWGDKPAFAFEPKPHWEIAEARGMLDLPRGAKISGSGFAVYTGAGARLQRALGAAMIDIQTARNGYHEVYPPYLVNRASLVGTGNLPKFEEDLYKADEDLYLIPTAEVPLTNLYRDEIIDGADLPVRLAGFSACFRREAGAAGKDTRGLLRIHQFDKVELVWFTRPEESYAALETLLGHAEHILQAFGLHYRVVELCAGDLGAKGAKCYDLELWAPGVGRYLEISSCTNFEAYQARRANIRYRPEPGAKPEFVHILNGSGLATPRLFAAVVETYLQPEDPRPLPDFLVPYLGPLGI
jgi:seryl-tRNA synthetase